MNTPLERIAKVLVVSSDIEKDLVFMEIVIEKAIENAGGEAYGPQKVRSPRTSTGRVILETGEDPSTQEAQLQVRSAGGVLCGQVLLLLQYLDRKREKYAGATTDGSYVELVRNRMRTKVTTTFAATAKARQNMRRRRSTRYFGRDWTRKSRSGGIRRRLVRVFAKMLRRPSV